jgi:hypothetical protein
MNNKTSVFIALLAVLMLCYCAVAQQPAEEATDNAAGNSAIQRSDIQARTGQVELGDQIETELEPGLASIETNFKARMEGLKTQMAAARDAAEMDQLQQQAQQLKVDWSIALANRQLELARARKDTQSEAAILETIENLMAQSSAKTTNQGGVR